MLIKVKCSKMNEDSDKKRVMDYNLDSIPINKCKLFEIEGEKIAVCHDSENEFRFFKLEPITKEKVSK